jgi:hypothetical protein
MPKTRTKLKVSHRSIRSLHALWHWRGRIRGSFLGNRKNGISSKTGSLVPKKQPKKQQQRKRQMTKMMMAAKEKERAKERDEGKERILVGKVTEREAEVREAGVEVAKGVREVRVCGIIHIKARAIRVGRVVEREAKKAVGKEAKKAVGKERKVGAEGVEEKESAVDLC